MPNPRSVRMQGNLKFIKEEFKKNNNVRPVSCAGC
jgi:hypothetical protein